MNTPLETAAVLLLHGDQVLVRDFGRRTALPQLQIRSLRRPAEELTSAIREAWKVDTVLLFRSSSSVYIAESMITFRPTRCDLRWVHQHELADDLLECENRRLHRSVQELEQFCNQSDAPFARTGWLRKLLHWVEERISAESPSLVYGVRQLNAGPQFTLLRIETSRGVLWFKATGGPNASECEITLCLAKLYPRFIALPIAHHSVWNGWLSHDVQGRLLCDLPSCLAWQCAGDELAQLQVASSTHIPSLLDAGCLDLRGPALRRNLDEFIEVFCGVERSEGHTSLSFERRLRDVLSEAIDVMEAINLPACLNHTDPNPENLVLKDEQCVFLDWAGAAVSSPLLTLEYLLRYCGGSPEFSERRETVSRRYMRRLSEGFAVEPLARAKQHSAQLAAYGFLISQPNWRESAAPDRGRTFARICRLIVGSADCVSTVA